MTNPSRDSRSQDHMARQMAHVKGLGVVMAGVGVVFLASKVGGPGAGMMSLPPLLAAALYLADFRRCGTDQDPAAAKIRKTMMCARAVLLLVWVAQVWGALTDPVLQGSLNTLAPVNAAVGATVQILGLGAVLELGAWFKTMKQTRNSGEATAAGPDEEAASR